MTTFKKKQEKLSKSLESLNIVQNFYLIPETCPTASIANVNPIPNEKFTDKKSLLPLNINCATEASEKEINMNVPKNSARNLRNVSFRNLKQETHFFRKLLYKKKAKIYYIIILYSIIYSKKKNEIYTLPH